MNKEVNDALHTLLNISLKDKSFSTQKQQFKIVYNYITNLQEENENLKDFHTKLQATKDRLDKYDKENQLRIDKALKYILDTDLSTLDKWKLQDILRGEE